MKGGGGTHVPHTWKKHFFFIGAATEVLQFFVRFMLSAKFLWHEPRSASLTKAQIRRLAAVSVQFLKGVRGSFVHQIRCKFLLYIAPDPDWKTHTGLLLKSAPRPARRYVNQLHREGCRFTSCKLDAVENATKSHVCEHSRKDVSRWLGRVVEWLLAIPWIVPQYTLPSTIL